MFFAPVCETRNFSIPLFTRISKVCLTSPTFRFRNMYFQKSQSMPELIFSLEPMAIVRSVSSSGSSTAQFSMTEVHEETREASDKDELDDFLCCLIKGCESSKAAGFLSSGLSSMQFCWKTWNASENVRWAYLLRLCLTVGKLEQLPTLAPTPESAGF